MHTAISSNSKECLDLIIENKITLILGNHELYYLYGAENIEPIMNKNTITIKEKTITYDRELFLDTMSNIDYPEKEFISRIFFGIR